MKGRDRAKECKPQGVVLYVSLQEDYEGFHIQTPLETRKRPWWIKNVCFFFFFVAVVVCYIHFSVQSTIWLIRSCFTDRQMSPFNGFSHPENMQFISIWKRFTGEKTNHSLSRSGECMWWATSENRNGLKLLLLLPPSSLTNGAAVERPLWVSCNFQQPLAGVGDLSSSQPSFSSASVSYLWPPSKVNVLPQVQINSSLTDQRPPLLLPLSTSTHTSPTTGEIRASLADLTAPLNTAPDRSLIAWLYPLCRHHHHLHSPSLIFAFGQKQLLYSGPTSPLLHSLTHNPPSSLSRENI